VLSLFEILAGQAAVAIKNARLYEDLKTAYEDLRHANDQVIKSERMAMKGDIAGAASHELKNMVGVVLLGLQVVQRKLNKMPDAAADMKEILDRTLDAARKIQVFSRNLLTGNRFSSAQLIPISPNKVAQDFIDFVKVLPKFKHNRLELVVDEDVPALALDVDEMQQVLLNLVNNAVEAHPDAAITVQTEYDIVEDIVRITVRDNGPGIDEAIRDKLLTERITTKADGHGYGLPICRQIVEHHGGRISIKSKKGRGTIVMMTFPVKRS
jgi:signal transduction histidine kinase